MIDVFHILVLNPDGTLSAVGHDGSPIDTAPRNPSPHGPDAVKPIDWSAMMCAAWLPESAVEAIDDDRAVSLAGPARNRNSAPPPVPVAAFIQSLRIEAEPNP